MRVTKFLSLLCFLCAVNPAFAQSTYKLQPGDEIEIWVAQYSDLTRSVTLAPDGWISLPLAGAVNAQGMTLEALQSSLVDRLQPFFNDDIGLNVSLIPSDQHQPSVFVAGDVETPGLYLYRPGMTVLHAISVAGGLYRTELGATAQDRSLEVQTLLANSEKRLVELDVMIARLNAQIEGRSDFDLPEGVRPNDAAGFIGRERALLSMQNSNIASQQTSLSRMAEINESSMSATSDQIESVKQRIVLAQERLAATNVLVDRGVMQASQARDIEVTVVDMETSLSQLRSTLATQQAAILNEQSRVAVLVQEYQVGLVTQLTALEQEREAVETERKSYEDTLAIYEPDTEAVQTLRYEIIRPSEGAEIDVDATERTTILPGDLIRVTRTTLSTEADGAPLEQVTDETSDAAPAPADQSS
nr:polysaccharide biosynthesis/export family protein [uncultured Devosia sp.]